MFPLDEILASAVAVLLALAVVDFIRKRINH
jgi:hypothetical protein